MLSRLQLDSAIGNLNQGCMEPLAKLWKGVTNGKHSSCISNVVLNNLSLIASFDQYCKKMLGICGIEINSIMKDIVLICVRPLDPPNFKELMEEYINLCTGKVSL